MRFIHIADLHLGAEPDRNFPWAKERAAAVRSSLSRIVDVCIREDTDLLLIAGDLFNRPPYLEELGRVNAQFSRLPRTKVVLIAGDFDFVRPGSTFASYPFAENVRFLCSEELSSVFFPQWNLEVHGFSYTARTKKSVLPDGYRVPQDGRRHILLAHGGDETHCPFRLSALSAQGWDYAALGHQHRPSISSDGRIAYPGTPEPLGEEETGQHGYFCGTLKADRFSITWRPFSTMEYTHLTVHVSPAATQKSVEALLRRRAGRDSREILSVVLKGERAPRLRFDTDAIAAVGTIVSVRDETVPAFPAQTDSGSEFLLQYRAAFPEKDRSEIEEKALGYGLEALMASLPAGKEKAE